MRERWNSVCFLHGLGSSPQGTKARFFAERFREEEVPYLAPDLNVPTTATQTLSAQLEALHLALASVPLPVLLMGSSFGGLLAIRYAHLHPERVAAVAVIAPVTEFRADILAKVCGSSLEQWKERQHLLFAPDATTPPVPLHYQLVEDALTHAVHQIRLPMPVLAIQGMKDDLVPWEATDRFMSRQHHGTCSMLVNGDHSLNDKLDVLWTLVGNWRMRIASIPR